MARAAPGAHADEDAAAQSLAAAAWERFGAAMDDDLAVPEALAALFDLVRDGNRALDAGCGVAGARALQETLVRIDATLALLPSATALPEGAAAILEARAAAREARDFATSDRLRDELAALGVVVEDGREGQRWRIEPRSHG